MLLVQSCTEDIWWCPGILRWKRGACCSHCRHQRVGFSEASSQWERWEMRNLISGINQIQIQYLLVLLGHAKVGFGTPLDLVSFLSLWCLAKNSVAPSFSTWIILYAHVVDYYACVHIVPSICLSVSIEYTDSVYWVGSQAGGAASRCLDMDSKQRGYTIGRGACSTKQDYICESRLHFSSACIEYTCIYLVAFIALLLIFWLACNHMWGLVLFKSWTSEWFDSKTIR